MTRHILLLALLLFTAACTSSAPQPALVDPTREPAPPPTQTSAPPGETAPSAGLDDEAFDLRLSQALESLDASALRAGMGDRFSIAVWDTGLREMGSAEALSQLQNYYLAEGAAPQVSFDSDVPALLEGADPLGLWGPTTSPVRALHVTGLGREASMEAVLVIGRDAAGDLYWHGILIPQGGFFHSTFPGFADIQPTEVEAIYAVEDVELRAGPGEAYAVMDVLRAGQSAQVTGKSPDGAWWRIQCTIDATGFCWAHDDPARLQPRSAP